MSQVYAEYHDRLGGFETHDAALAWIPERATVIDVGCATGFFAQRLAEERKCRVIGVEGDAAAAAKARQVCERVHAGDLSDEKFLAGIGEQADVVFFGDVLEHLVDPVSLLEKARAWLKPGGFFLCSVPNVAYWKIRVELLLGRFDYQEIGILDRTHLRFYTRASFGRLLSENGFSVSAVTPVCSDPAALSLRDAQSSKRPSRSPVRAFILKCFPGLMATQFLFRVDPGRLSGGSSERARDE